jgi:kinetochor protein Mis14/NSL1
METQHRKIELQSPSDLTFLTSQIRTAAREKLDLHLPPVSDSSEPDELRRQVEDLVDAFVAQVLAGMKGNISINGMDVEGAIDGEGTVEATMEGVEREEFEPFDEKLRGKVGSAIARRDALVGKISAHRRTTGEAAAKAFQQQFERENEVVAKQVVVEGEEGDMDIAGVDIAGVDALEREEEVRRNWERAVEGLGRLNKGLPETRARLERAGDVVGYLGGEKKG